ncbi:MAG: hypothetical protein OHK0038_04420 [Flammeovirgaceae bacterium]
MNSFSFIKIQGKALRSKAGAFLLSENGESFFIDQTDSWGDLEGKNIEVQGYLTKENPFPTETSLKNSKGEYLQGIVGEKNILKNVKILRVLNS